MEKICFLAILLSFLSITLSEMTPKFSGVFALGTGVLFFSVFFRFITPLWKEMGTLSENLPAEKIFEPLFKGLGIGLMVSLVSSFCRDLGETRVAEKLEICGKGAVLWVALPVLKELISLTKGILL